MAAGAAMRGTGRARRDRDHLDNQVASPDRLRRKRPCSVEEAEDEDGDTTGHRRKRLRPQGSPNKSPQASASAVYDDHFRKSPRLQQARVRRQTRSSPRLRPPKDNHCPPQKNAGPATTLPANIGIARGTKRRHFLDEEDKSNLEAKRLKHGIAPNIESKTAVDKESFIDCWLNESFRSQTPSSDTQPSVFLANMPRKSPTILPSPGGSSEPSLTTTTSTSTGRSAARVDDSNYRTLLSSRNVYIEREDPSQHLMSRAREIISRERMSPEVDDRKVDRVRRSSRELQNGSESTLIKQLVPDMIPAMQELPDRRLGMNSDQPWSNSVPLPLKTSILISPLALPKPKPDLAFGYSEAAFTENQLGTIDLLVDDQFGQSYALPDQRIRFPFLQIEFKSQAKNGTHYVATNQAAGAGAIALKGSMELIQRSFGMENFDYDEPQYFSMSMDYELARINIHWLKAPAEGGGQHSFHVERLSQHLLSDASGIRAVSRAIKNILDYGADVRLRTLCSALDAYRETVVRNRQAASSQRGLEDDTVREGRAAMGKISGISTAPPRGEPSCERDQIRRPLRSQNDPMQSERRPLRAQTMARREERSRTDLPPKMARSHLRRASRVAECE